MQINAYLTIPKTLNYDTNRMAERRERGFNILSYFIKKMSTIFFKIKVNSLSFFNKKKDITIERQREGKKTA